ncbi:MAG: ion transporter [bacterium]|nr:ion transporter [bacterium]
MNDNLNNDKSLRGKIRFYLIDCKSIPGKLIDISIISLNILVCVLFVIDTYTISEAARKILWRIENTITVFFIIEYIARLYGARNRLKHLFNIYSLIDLIAILPILSVFFTPAVFKIGFIRIFRVLRIFRFLRFTEDAIFFFGSISLRLLRVIRLLFTIGIIFFVSSGFFWFSESGVNPEQVKNFGDAFYFSVVTLTTVGFGDITPVSEGGRWVTVVMILSGIILIPWQVGKIVKEWLELSGKKEAICSQCGLKYHDHDASHCKACGKVIFQEFDGL